MKKLAMMVLIVMAVNAMAIEFESQEWKAKYEEIQNQIKQIDEICNSKRKEGSKLLLKQEDEYSEIHALGWGKIWNFINTYERYEKEYENLVSLEYKTTNIQARINWLRRVLKNKKDLYMRFKEYDSIRNDMTSLTSEIFELMSQKRKLEERSELIIRAYSIE